jgi:hypothetical protein
LQGDDFTRCENDPIVRRVDDMLLAIGFPDPARVDAMLSLGMKTPAAQGDLFGGGLR